MLNKTWHIANHCSCVETNREQLMLFHHDHFYVEWSPRKDNRLPKTQPNHKILCQSKRNALKWPWPTLELWHTLFFFFCGQTFNFCADYYFFLLSPHFCLNYGALLFRKMSLELFIWYWTVIAIFKMIMF